jgi:hypothetical protein
MGNQVSMNGVDLEVYRALECNCAKSPYLARQLSVFEDQQLIMGVTQDDGRWASVYAELDGKHKRVIYTGPGRCVA